MGETCRSCVFVGFDISSGLRVLREPGAESVREQGAEGVREPGAEENI
jgi:hypothetical protein